MENLFIVAEGKTKIIYRAPGAGMVVVKSKDDITKNDDPSQTQVMQNKAVYSTATTCAVFSLLKEAGIPVAFQEQLSETEFLALNCKMISLEVIARRYAVGSYLKRYPNLDNGGAKAPHRFHRLVFELFLKTTGGVVKNQTGKVIQNLPDDCLEEKKKPVDDPFILDYDKEVWDLRHPKIPNWIEDSKLFCPVFRNNILPENITVKDIENITRKTFLVLEGAWRQFGCRLIDFKIELGIDSDGKLLVADVIDNDSWRLRTSDWQELSKQLFRDNVAFEEIADKYALVTSLVKRFNTPKQAIVFWCGSKSDSISETFSILSPGVSKIYCTISGHKSTLQALAKLDEILTEFPEGGVIITFVGMSDGLGPILAAHTSWPVIAVPATQKERPHDVWSSLEVPSNVPLSTILSAKNAVLNALDILSLNNPIAYMHRQFEIEEMDI